MQHQPQADSPRHPQHMHSVSGRPGTSRIEELLAVVVPGRMIQTHWEIVGTNRAVLCSSISTAVGVPNVMVSILPGKSNFMRPELAAVVYWSCDGTQWNLLGALWQQKPSALFRTGWGNKLAHLPTSEVKLAVSLESISVAANLGLDVLAGGSTDEHRHFALGIAKDLWNFLASFSRKPTSTPTSPGCVQSNGEWMMVPVNILDRWMERFEAKYRRDPNFMLKRS